MVFPRVLQVRIFSKYKSCLSSLQFSDSVTARSLRYGPMAITGQLTVEKCQAACAGGNYVLSGVEYAAECCKSHMHICFTSLVFYRFP